MLLKRRITWLFTILCIMILLGCSTTTNGPKSVNDMTPKELATWMMGIYNSQARDYKALAAKPDLTEPEREVLRSRKAALTQLWPMINTYTIYVDSGAVPTREVEDNIIKMINELTSLTMPLLEGG